MKTKGTKGPAVVCEICGKLCKSPQGLLGHQRLVHNIEHESEPGKGELLKRLGRLEKNMDLVTGQLFQVDSEMWIAVQKGMYNIIVGALEEYSRGVSKALTDKE